MKTSLRGLVVLGVVLTTASCYDPAADGYEIVWEDTFDDGVLDPVWQPAPFENGTIAPVEANGVLRIERDAINDQHWHYIQSTGPRQATEPNYPDVLAFEEGFIEARVRYIDNEWAWPAFWMFSAAKNEAWPGENCSLLTSELDIMENGLNNGTGANPSQHAYFLNLHRNTADGTPDGYCGQLDEQRQLHQDFPDTNLSEWHVWSARWTADEICGYIDREPIGCISTFPDSTAQPMYIVFSVNHQGLCGGCGPKPSTMWLEVDYVTIWQKTDA